MDSVRNAAAAAWVVLGRLFLRNSGASTEIRLSLLHVRASITSGTSLGVTVWYLRGSIVGLTIVVFAVLILILKGVETL